MNPANDAQAYANEQNQPPREFLTSRQLAELLGISESTAILWRMQGKGPAFIKVGRSVRYDRADVDAWLASNRIGGQG